MKYHASAAVLWAAGYHKYEISNFAKAGKRCRHNVGYWKRYNYLGFGLSAHSLYDNVRFANTDDFQKYLGENIISYEERLSREDIIGEFMFLGLRMTEGVSFDEFKTAFNSDIYEVFPGVIEKYSDLGLIERDEKRLWLTEKGIDVSNTIFADFLL